MNTIKLMNAITAALVVITAASFLQNPHTLIHLVLMPIARRLMTPQPGAIVG